MAEDISREVIDKFEKVVKNMTDRELNNLLLVGEGMAIMSGIKEKEKINQDAS